MTFWSFMEEQNSSQCQDKPISLLWQFVWFRSGLHTSFVVPSRCQEEQSGFADVNALFSDVAASSTTLIPLCTNVVDTAVQV